jgi:hypothetical protein
LAGSSSASTPFLNALLAVTVRISGARERSIMAILALGLPRPSSPSGPRRWRAGYDPEGRPLTLPTSKVLDLEGRQARPDAVDAILPLLVERLFKAFILDRTDSAQRERLLGIAVVCREEHLWIGTSAEREVEPAGLTLVLESRHSRSFCKRARGSRTPRRRSKKRVS